VQTAPRAALWRVRQALGVQRYLLETRRIFADQVRDIRAAIVALDNGLPAHPRQVGDPARLFHPWTPLNLGPHFDRYMNDVWHNAQEELASFIEDIHDKIRPRCSPRLRQQYSDRGDQNMITLCKDWEIARAQRATYGAVQRPW
jgi:hypothetical protein